MFPHWRKTQFQEGGEAFLNNCQALLYVCSGTRV
jgi:hypothetical protein